MKIIFAGTPVFAAVALQALIQSSHQVLACYTQPDRPAGRGLKLLPSPVKEIALANNIPLYQPLSLKDAEQQNLLASFNADAMVVAAYGMLLPATVLNLFPFGCINIHPSLLPRWRGAAPIQRTLYAGDTISGVSIMQMDEGLDTGPILLQHQMLLDENETSQTLHDKLAQLGASLLIEALDLYSQKKLSPQKQDDRLATYAHKIKKDEALIDWHCPAIELEQKIRAFNPWPVAYTMWQGKNLRIWFAKALSQEHQAIPGTILSATQKGICIATGQKVLSLQALQLPGGKVLNAADFYNAHYQQFHVGQLLA